MQQERAPDPRSSFRHRVEVAESDIDELGHVNNLVYLRYVEEVARAHAAHVEMGFAALKTLGVLPVVHRRRITYHRPAKLGDALEVETTVTLMRGARAQRHSEVRLDSGTLLADAITDWVWIDPRRGQPKATPQVVLKAFGWA